MPPFLSVIIPAYNEENRISNCLEDIQAYLAHQDNPEQTEILIIDDGSTDNTIEAASAWNDRIPTLKVISNPSNMGKGATIRNGMKQASGSWRLFTDADNSTPFAQVSALLEVAESSNADIIIGSRALRDSKLEVRQPWMREMMGRTFNLLVQSIALPGIKDTQCGFKLFSAEAAERIFPRITFTGFSFDVEALFIGRKLGYKIVEVPVRWINDERSTVSPFGDSLAMFLDLVRVRIRHRGLKKS